tara:strand:+ start:557 stop:2458 length:1902 start_codon:yes stop_codon:yes gene_type:complete
VRRCRPSGGLTTSSSPGADAGARPSLAPDTCQVFDAACDTSSSPADFCSDGDPYIVSTTGPLFCYGADLSQTGGGGDVGSQALLEATTAIGLTTDEMNYRCCDMTDYYILTGVVDGMNKPSDDFSADSTCTLDAVANGDYESSGPCVVGATLYSGYRCTPNCTSGYTASGDTTCVKGTLTAATCDANDSSDPPPPSPPSPSPPLLPPPSTPPLPPPSPPPAAYVNAFTVHQNQKATDNSFETSSWDGIDSHTDSATSGYRYYQSYCACTTEAEFLEVVAQICYASSGCAGFNYFSGATDPNVIFKGSLDSIVSVSSSSIYLYELVTSYVAVTSTAATTSSRRRKLQNDAGGPPPGSEEDAPDGTGGGCTRRKLAPSKRRALSETGVETGSGQVGVPMGPPSDAEIQETMEARREYRHGYKNLLDSCGSPNATLPPPQNGRTVPLPYLINGSTSLSIREGLNAALEDGSYAEAVETYESELVNLCMSAFNVNNSAIDVTLRDETGSVTERARRLSESDALQFDMAFYFTDDANGYADGELLLEALNSSEFYEILSYSFSPDDLGLSGEVAMAVARSDGVGELEPPTDPDVNCPICNECARARMTRRMLFGSFHDACALCDECKLQQDYSYVDEA